MKKVFLLLSASLTLVCLYPQQGNAESREEKQSRLDTACESGRQKKLAPLREELVEECVARKQRSSREDCEQFHENYGARSGQRPALFYDLPECMEAFDFQRSIRSSDSP